MLMIVAICLQKKKQEGKKVTLRNIFMIKLTASVRNQAVEL